MSTILTEVVVVMEALKVDMEKTEPLSSVSCHAKYVSAAAETSCERFIQAPRKFVNKYPVRRFLNFDLSCLNSCFFKREGHKLSQCTLII